MALTDAQLAERQHYLGGTDLAALAGVSRWGNAVTVFADKRPDVLPPPPRQTSPMMALGNLLEGVVADLASAATDTPVRRAPARPSPWVDGYRTTARQCPDHPWEGANTDRLLGEGILECKWGEQRRLWGETQTAWVPVVPPVVPMNYYVQTQHYLHVTGRPWAVLAVLLGYADFRWYTIVPDPVLQAAMVDLGASFWADHVVPGVVPPPDGSDHYDARLRHLYAADDGTQRAATIAEADLLARYRALDEDVATATKARDAIRQALMASMGTVSRIDATGASVTWRQNKPTTRTVTDWEAVARALQPPTARLDLLVQKHTTTTVTDGARPLRITYHDDET